MKRILARCALLLLAPCVLLSDRAAILGKSYWDARTAMVFSDCGIEDQANFEHPLARRLYILLKLARG